MSQIPFPSDVTIVFAGTCDFTGTVALPDGTVTSASFSSVTADALDADKQEHRIAIPYSQASGSDVTSETKLLYLARNAGSIKAVEVVPSTAPTGGDKQFTVDVQKSTGAAAFATVLSSAVTVSSSSTDRTSQNGSVSSAAYVANDIFQVVITASGSTGSQGQGFTVVLTVDEQPA